jgi:hypothetical protein
LAGLAALGVRFTRLSEEMPEYARQIPASVWDLTSRAGKRDRKRLEAQAIARSRVWVRWRDLQFRLVCRAGVTLSPLRRLLLRQLTNGFSCIHFSLIVFVYTLFILFIERPLLGEVADAKRFAWMPFLMGFLEVPFFIGMSGMGGIFLQHWPHIAHESLHPVSRPDFIRDLFRSTAFTTAMIAMAHCAAIILGLALWDHDSRCMPYLPGILTAAIVQYVVFYSLALWLGSFHSMLAYVFGVVPCFLLFLFAALFAARFTPRYIVDWLWSPVTMAVVIAAALATAYGLYRLAFRRWRRIDFD